MTGGVTKGPAKCGVCQLYYSCKDR